MRKILICIMITIVLFPNITMIHGYENHNVEIYVKGGTYDIGTYNSTLVVKEDASVQVEEIIRFRFYSGSFSYAYRYINYWKLDDIVNVTVGEIKNGSITWYTEGEHDYGYIVDKKPDRALIKWFYPTLEVNAPVEKTFILRYTALAVIDEIEKNNVLDWDAVPADTPLVAEANVKVVIPRSFNYSELSIMPSPRSVYTTSEKTIILFSQKNIPEGKAYRIIVQFPKFIEPRFSLRRFLNENEIIFWLIIIPLAVVSFITVWYFKGRDEKVPRSKLEAVRNKYKELAYGGAVPPPSNLKPSEAMVLIRRKIDGGTWIALLYDLAARGYLRIIDMKDGNTGIELTEKSKNAKTQKDLKEYEREYLKLIKEIHTELKAKNKEINNIIPLRDFAIELMRHRKRIKQIKDILMMELLNNDYFYTDPRKLRLRWSLLFLIPALIGVSFLILGAIYYVRGLIEIGLVQLFSFTVVIVLTLNLLSTRTEKGVIAAEEAKSYSKGLLKKLEYFAKIKKEELEKVLKEVIEINIGWLLLTRYGKKLIPQEIMQELRGYPYWYPYWYGSTRKPIQETPQIDITSSLTSLNNAFARFKTMIGFRGGGIGGAGVGGGGGAGGGGAGAG